MKKINKLFAYGIGGLFPCFGMAYAFHIQSTNRLKNSTLYKEAMNALKEHKGAAYFLGHPIEDANPRFANLGLRFSDRSEVRVKVSGPKGDGILFITVLPGQDETLYLGNVLLQVGKDVSKRLVIKMHSQEASSDSLSLTKKILSTLIDTNAMLKVESLRKVELAILPLNILGFHNLKSSLLQKMYKTRSHSN